MLVTGDPPLEDSESGPTSCISSSTTEGRAAHEAPPRGRVRALGLACRGARLLWGQPLELVPAWGRGRDRRQYVADVVGSERLGLREGGIAG